MRERGAALAMVLFALVVLGEIAALGFMIASEEVRAGRNAVELQHATAAAEWGVEDVRKRWASSPYAHLAIGESAPIGWTALPGRAGWYRGEVTRLNGKLFLIRAEGFNPTRITRHEAAQIGRLQAGIGADTGLSRLRERAWLGGS
jgi:hypothetical protein